MTDAWEMHQAETGLNPGPVWRDRGTIIANLTARNQALEERVAELELAALNLRDQHQGAHEREQALRARIEALADDESRHLIRWIDGSHLVDVDDLRAALAASPAVDATPEPTPAAEPQVEVGAPPGIGEAAVLAAALIETGHTEQEAIERAIHLLRPAPVADPSGDTP